MKNLRIMMAAASMMILLFCGSEAVAQSSDYSATKNLDLKQMVDLSSVEFVSDAEALEIISTEYKSIAGVDSATEEIENSIKVAFYSHITGELVSNKSIANVMSDGRSELVKIANRFVTPADLSLESIFNDAVALVEDN